MEYKKKCNGAEIVLRSLADHRANIVFGYPGGATLPIYDELYLKMDNPDYIVILTWNIMDEITDQLNYHKSILILGNLNPSSNY